MFMHFFRRRSRRGIWPLLSRFFYLNPQKQYLLIVISAITMATFVFSGLLLFRQSDQGDLMTRGKWLMRQGKAALAVKEFEHLVRSHRGSYDGHLELGKAYMAIEEPEKAAKEFRVASRLRSKNPKESGAHVAISRYMLAQGNYEDAEKQLFQAYKARKQNRKDPELLMAIVDMYDDWGDSYLEANPPDYEKAFLKYSAGLRFVKSQQQQKPLQEKLVKTATHLAGIYDNNKEYDKAIAVLKRALHYDYSTNNLMAIAAMYEQKEDLDEAIVWYRKAYKKDPNVISLTLSSILMKKGRELNEAHQPKLAEQYFAEAKKINATVKLPIDTLYPVEATNVDLAYKINSDAFDMAPTVKFDISNKGSYPINYLAVKVFFLTGDEKLADAQRVIATNHKPLAPSGEPKGRKTLEIKPKVTIPLEDLEKGKLRVQMMVSYSDKEDTKWYEIKNAEITVPEAATINGG